MIFEHNVIFYKLNDDATVTVKCGENYYRCKARYDMLKKFDGIPQNTEFKLKFGLAYLRGQGLILQIIEVL